MKTNDDQDLVKRLQSLAPLAEIPKAELEWLVQHGNLEIYQPGLIASKGAVVEFLWIILEGHITTRIDRGAGPKVVNTEIQSGTVTGMLPYSRLGKLPGNGYAEKTTRLLSVSSKHFPQMINKCPLFTAHTVHTMIDRTRIHNTSALQDEKMISIGKLAAGLAHELDNPASAAIRNAKLLREMQSQTDSASGMLSKAALNEEQFNQIEKMRALCIEMSQNSSLSAMEKSDLQDTITEWLEQRQLDTIYAAGLADLAVKIENLDNLYNTLTVTVFESVLKWIVSSCATHTLSLEIEQAARQINKLVDEVKKFSHMDNLAETEMIDIEAAIGDSLKVLESKIKQKNAVIRLQIDKGLPPVCANGAELNQVWFSLLDNALDAIPQSGEIEVHAFLETDHLVVRIIDDGAGIPVSDLDRIFDPFFTTKSPGQGTGLGLDLSRRIIRRYNGDIFARSKEGKTEFHVTFGIEKS